MKNKIVVKLFLITSFFSVLVLIGVFFGQSIFFETYYIKNKEEHLLEEMEQFKKDYHEESTRISELEQTFTNENNAWITVLDANGYIEDTTNINLEIDNSYVSVNDEYDYDFETTTVPLIYLENTFDDSEQLTSLSEYTNHQIEIHGIQDGMFYFPYEIIVSKEKATNETILSNEIVDNYFYWKNNYFLEQAKKHLNDENYTYKNVYGIISSANIPDNYNLTHATTISNQVFFDQLKVIQSDLLFNDLDDNLTKDEPSINEFKKDGITYRLIINMDENGDGEPIYFVTLSSLQPIDEASGLLQEYYIYVLFVVLLLVLIASFYFSKRITNPLVKINKTAKQMANLNFKDSIPVKTKDEIGQLSESINTLSNKLKSHINQLHEDIAKEKQLEKTRKDFIAGVSHELKTPLSIMKSCISVIEDGVATDKRDHYFQAMHMEVDRMDRLIVDMLELAKFESGTYKLDMDPHSILDSITSVTQQLAIKAQDKDIQMNIDISPVEVLMNKHRIEQVLTNFLTNAIRHTPKTGKIYICTEEHESRVKISIENEGEQISPDQLSKIWDNFYQEDKTSRSKDGTGLGLAISEKILTLHDAEYGVKNTSRGVCFYFYLRIMNY